MATVPTFVKGALDTLAQVLADLFTGAAGGQTIIGGTAASEDLTLQSTANATRGSVFLGSATEFELDEAAGQLKLPTVGSGAGLVLGGDAQLFRGAADRLDLASGDSLRVVGGDVEIEGDLTLLDGGTVTQITSISTGVTLNTRSGQITTVSQTIGAGLEATFTVTDSVVAAIDTIIANLQSTASAGGPFLVFVSAVAAGSFDITISNLGSVAGDNTLLINFNVIKGSAS